MSGKLYICPTPIGNLEDITLRTLRVLKEVDIIAAEDTRHTVKLLNYYDIETKLISYHEYNKEKRAEEIVEKTNRGFETALVSDSGMPGISDPAYRVIQKALQADLSIVSLPGATALIPAVVVSGLPSDRFVFEGFLPSSEKRRRNSLRALTSEERTIILYESPHRLLALLEDINRIMGRRRAAVIRELTKKHEEISRGWVDELCSIFKKKKIRGEFTVVLEGNDSNLSNSKEIKLNLLEHLYLLIDEGISKKKAISIVAKERGLSKKEVYKVAIQIKGDRT